MCERAFEADLFKQLLLISSDKLLYYLSIERRMAYRVESLFHKRETDWNPNPVYCYHVYLYLTLIVMIFYFQYPVYKESFYYNDIRIG